MNTKNIFNYYLGLLVIAATLAGCNQPGSIKNDNLEEEEAPHTNGDGDKPGPNHLSVTGPGTIMTGQCAPIQVLTLNASNVTTGVTTALSVFLSTTTTLTSFYSDAACTTVSTIAYFPIGVSSDTVYVKTTQSSNFQVNYTSSLGSGSVGIIVQAGNIDHFALSGPSSVATGSCSGAFQVQAMDDQGALSSATSNISIGFSGLSSAHVYSDMNCTTMVTTVDILMGQSSAQFYLKNTSPQQINFQTTTLMSNILSVDFSSSSLLVVQGPTTVRSDLCSTIFTVSAYGQGGADHYFASQTTIDLSATANSGTFYTNAACTQVATTLVIPAGQNSGSFYFKAAPVVDAAQLSAALSGFGTGVAVVTVEKFPLLQSESVILRSRNVAVTSSGNIFSVGVRSTSLNQYLGTGFLSAFSPTGLPLSQWSNHATFGNTTGVSAEGIALDSNGNLVVGFTNKLSNGTYRAALRRYSSAGAIQLNQDLFPSESRTITGLAVDAANDIIVVGIKDGTLVGEFVSGSNSDAFIAKIDGLSGAVLMDRVIATTGADALLSVAIAPNGQIYAGGSTTRVSEWITGGTQVGTTDGIIVSINPATLASIVTKSWGFASQNHSIIDITASVTSVFVLGAHQARVGRYGLNLAQIEVESVHSGEVAKALARRVDGKILVLTQNGTTAATQIKIRLYDTGLGNTSLWTKTHATGSSGSVIDAKGLAVTPANQIYVSGGFQGLFNGKSSGSNQDGVVIRLDANGDIY